MKLTQEQKDRLQYLWCVRDKPVLWEPLQKLENYALLNKDTSVNTRKPTEDFIRKTLTDIYLLRYFRYGYIVKDIEEDPEENAALRWEGYPTTTCCGRKTLNP